MIEIHARPKPDSRHLLPVPPLPARAYVNGASLAGGAPRGSARTTPSGAALRPVRAAHFRPRRRAEKAARRRARPRQRAYSPAPRPWGRGGGGRGAGRGAYQIKAITAQNTRTRFARFRPTLFHLRHKPAAENPPYKKFVFFLHFGGNYVIIL